MFQTLMDAETGLAINNKFSIRIQHRNSPYRSPLERYPL